MPVSRLQKIGHSFRLKRFAFFKEQIAALPRPLRILDLGGTETYWEAMSFSDQDIHVFLLNIEPIRVKNPLRFTAIQGDVCDLSAWGEGSFDLVYSNSVIEHLFSWENQVKMAKEVRRVGKHYFIQTPHYWFPIEPHWMLPGFQFLPRAVRILLTRYGSFGYIKRKNTYKDAALQVDEVRLLREKEMKRLFPEAKIYRERWGGMVKSICAYFIEEKKNVG